MKVTITKLEKKNREVHFRLNKTMTCLEVAVYLWVIVICWGVEKK